MGAAGGLYDPGGGGGLRGEVATMTTERELATVHNYRETEGDTFADDLVFTDSAGAAVDLSGITGAAFTVADTFDSTAAAVWSATQAGGEITIPTPANGTVLIRKSLDGLAPGSYVYHYSHTVGGVLQTFLRGAFELHAKAGPTP
jgi:hypothetical protein